MVTITHCDQCEKEIESYLYNENSGLCSTCIDADTGFQSGDMVLVPRGHTNKYFEVQEVNGDTLTIEDGYVQLRMNSDAVVRICSRDNREDDDWNRPNILENRARRRMGD